MNKETVYWKWKNTIIDFDVISNETIDYNEYITKKDYIFHYLGTPDKQIHEWYNGGFSSEYNSALRYAKQLGLVVNYVDYDNEIYELKQQCQEQKEVIDKATNELFILKDMIYKPKTREENFEIQRKISSIIKRLNGKEVSE